MAIRVFAFYLCGLWYIAPSGGIARTTEIMFNTVFKDSSLTLSTFSSVLLRSKYNLL